MTMQAPPVSQTTTQQPIFYGPPPKVYMDAQIKPREVIEVRPWEPIYIFVEMKMGAATSIEGLNKHTPFKVEAAEKPEHAAAPRCMGQWFKVSADAKAKPGKTDLVKIVSRGLYSGGVQGPPKVDKYFTLKVGHVRYY